jgi:hypothetical protein
MSAIKPNRDVEHMRAIGRKGGSATRYSLEDVDRGLTAVALANGNTREAAKRLARERHRIPRGTLELWARRTYAARYDELRAELVPKIHAKLATEMEDALRQGLEVQTIALAKTRERLEAGQSKDPAADTRSVATANGITAQHVRVFRDRPTALVATIDITDVARRLAESRPDVFSIDSTATELPSEDTAPQPEAAV